MTTAAGKVVLGCGDLIVVAPGKGFGVRISAAVAASGVPLYLREKGFSTQAAAVVAPDPSMMKGIVRQAAECNIRVLSEQQALDAISLLNTPLLPGWCDCAEPILPRECKRSWEHHRFGVCGWPKSRCSIAEHRRSWCRACHRFLRLRFCQCTGDWGFGYDRDREWWVHAACGWPTQGWFSASGARIPDSVDGTPSWLWRAHEARSDLELKARPLPAEVSLIDRQWEGRLVED